MKEKKKNEIQCCKLQRSRKLVPHFKSNSVPTIVMWTLGLAISRSLMTAIRAASEECGRWELDPYLSSTKNNLHNVRASAHWEEMDLKGFLIQD